MTKPSATTGEIEMMLHAMKDLSTHRTPDATTWRGEWRARLLCRLPIAMTLAFLFLISDRLTAQPVEVDIRALPNGTAPPPNGIITTQWQSMGITFAARRSSEPVGQPGSISPIAGGSGSLSRWLFFTPDVFGAVAIFRFFAPGTTTPIDATSFQMSADFDSFSERVELIGFDELGVEVARQDRTSPCSWPTPCSTPVSISGRFRYVELRTFGNPGIAFRPQIRFTLCNPRITSQPSNTSACRDQWSELSVAVDPASTPTISWRWQVESAAGSGIWQDLPNGPRIIDGATWGTIADANTATLRVRPDPENYALARALRFRCIISTSCGDLVSDPATLATCACLECSADFNQDGGTDGSDVVAFFEAWEGGSCDADVNADGGVDGGDASAFFAAWEAGGC